MYLLYSLAFSLAFLILSPYFIYKAIKHGKYRGSFRQRLGRLPREALGGDRPTIWVHTVSVGEFNAALPLIAALRRAMPEHKLVVSTTTITGQRLARARCADQLDAAFYFPFDWAFVVRRALDLVNPSLVVILETELWPNFLRECRKRGVATVLANGRISPRSFARYRKIRPFISRVLSDLSLLVMQSEADRERALSLGAAAEKAQVCGNLKYDVATHTGQKMGAPEAIDSQVHTEIQHSGDALNRLFALGSSPHLIVAGSTAQGEEEIVLRTLGRVRKAGLEGARLIIAPRHPERFDEVAALILKSGFKLARRSEIGVGQQGEIEYKAARSADVILLDTIGDLAEVYRFASVVFVGGSLVARGGHNIIEPAVYAKPIIVGPHTENFRQIVSDFALAEAVVQVENTGECASEVIRLLSDREEARRMGKRARDIILINKGATDCTVAAIIKTIRYTVAE